ncbi:polysaccharide biosynthesis/export family protein [Anaeromyxobacter paludicola]|uniref:polysaccharide biosynthesis/export family protein n=1 Tax=Anaeromyxobacter paludicola TaxID=2918171 RepID=UPI0020BF3260|nr:polysaccharide biosynthesis/export family protein [Anaeromyxobacter paludicola]
MPAPRQEAEYRIGREDVLEIVVYHEPELTRVMPVRPDGKIAMPLAGELEAAGKTAPELKAELTRALAPYVRDAAVSVLVREVNGPKVFVMGEVNKPGGFPLRGSMSVVQAIALAGGTGEFAGNEVVLLRQSGAEGVERVKLSYRELVRGEGKPLWLSPGDVVYVP